MQQIKSIVLGLCLLTIFSVSASAQQKSLYERLGGKDAISAVVDDFAGNVLADPRINKKFARTDANRLLANLKDFVCFATGGPCKYTGLDMKTSHKNMGTTSGEFSALVEDLVKTLNKFRVPEREKSELLGALAKLRGDIVESESGATGTNLPASFRPAPPLGAKRTVAASTTSKSLYERLGGKDAISAVVNDFAGNVLADARINKKFAMSDANRLVTNLKDFVCFATGGPCQYTGLDMKSAHKNMGTTAGEFNALVEDLVKTLNKFRVPEKEKNELLGALGGLRGDIVESESGATGLSLPAAFRPAPPLGAKGAVAASTSSKSLYERLGGKDAISAVVDDFAGNVLADARINKKFAISDANRLVTNLKDFVCFATGGPCQYTGLDMKSAHKNMGTTAGEFNALVEDLVKTLNKFRVPEKERNELLGALGGLRGDIVESESSATGLSLPAAFRPAPPLGAKGGVTGSASSLFERLGGKDAISAVVDDFAGNVLADARINKKFARTDATRLLANLKDFVCFATGGPCQYTGLDMKSAHKNMGTTAGEFNALVEDLVKTLNKFRVPEREKNELLTALAGLKGDIVESESAATGTDLPAAFRPAPPLGGKGAVAGSAPPLYERLGGKDAISAVVNDFAGNVLADARINKKFARTDATRLLANLKDFVCFATGGPCQYTGLDMKSAHKNMGTTAGEFNALVEDLVKTLNKFNVPEKEKNELLNALAGLRGDIVENEATFTGTDLPASFKPAPPLGAPATASASTSTSSSTSSKYGTLFDRIGGMTGISAVVDDFAGTVLADPRINKKFAKTNATRLVANLKDFMCNATGGPCQYNGLSMKKAHDRMRVTSGEFNALVEDLVKSLDKLRIPEREKNDLLTALANLKGDVVRARDDTSETGTELPKNFKPAPPVGSTKGPKAMKRRPENDQ